ncbi:hypothetical protein D3C74_450950 [compost metagenome]
MGVNDKKDLNTIKMQILWYVLLVSTAQGKLCREVNKAVKVALLCFILMLKSVRLVR